MMILYKGIDTMFKNIGVTEYFFYSDPYPANIFVQKCCSLSLLHSCSKSQHWSANEYNTHYYMNPDQTAPKEAG